jgi:3-oxoacyl-[acyl-carrier protein] reductase
MTTRPVAVVTGASRGIGRATALRLAERYDVVALARTKPALESLAKAIEKAGGKCTPLVVDMADEAAIVKALRGLDVDLLVNNAGVITIKPFMEMTAAEAQEMLDVNLRGLITATRAVLPGMIKRKRGFIVMVSSLAGRNNFVGGTVYSATKHGVNGFAESLMLEVRDHGIRIATIMPGSVDTRVREGATDQSWMLTTEQVAESVWYTVTQGDNALISRIEMRPAAPKKH